MFSAYLSNTLANGHMFMLREVARILFQPKHNFLKLINCTFTQGCWMKGGNQSIENYSNLLFILFGLKPHFELLQTFFDLICLHKRPKRFKSVWISGVVQT